MRFDFEDMYNGLNDFEQRVRSQLHMYADTAAIKLKSHAQRNAKWTDHTTGGLGARGQLNSYVSHPNREAIRINLAHGVDYGIWLELANQRRFAIIQPTISHLSQEIFNGLNRLFDRLN